MKIMQQQEPEEISIEDECKSDLRRVLINRYFKISLIAVKQDLEIMDLRQFQLFSIEDNSFLHAYYDWIQSDFQKNISPVLERIDLKKGFTRENLRWTTSEKKNRSNRKSIRIVEGDSMKEFPSARKAELAMKLPRGVLSRALRDGGKYKKLRVLEVNN